MSDENFSNEPNKPGAEADVARTEGSETPSKLWAALYFSVVVVVAALVAYLGNTKLDLLDVKNEQSVKPDAADSGQELFRFSLARSAFAGGQPAPAVVTPSQSGEKPEIGELANLEAFEKAGVSLGADRQAALRERGFFLAENDIIGDQEWGTDDFADAYAAFGGSPNPHYRQPHEALYISSDAALHLYHLLIDRSFQRIEEQRFQPMLAQMSRALFADSISRHKTASSQEEKATYERLSAFYLIPLLILDAGQETAAKPDPSDFATYAQYLEAEQKALEDAARQDLDLSLGAKEYDGFELPDEVYAVARAELGLIASAEGLADSPLFTPYRPYLKNDYTQFKPRSHYTKNAALKSYFIAMMWYGRMGFSLDSPDLTRDAIAITGQVNTLSAEGGSIASMYNDLSAAIEFFVGETDDLTPYEYTVLIKRIYGETLDAGEFADAVRLEQFARAAISELPRPRIVSEAVELFDDGGERDQLLMQLMQFRFMGQRFTPDAYVLNNLTQGAGAPDPETGQNLPSMTTALMPIYVISGGNEVVRHYIDKWVVENAPDSGLIIKKKLAGLIQEFSGYPEEAWARNIYWRWLGAYRPLLGGYGAGYPYFMTTESWQKKNLGTVLGSYAELKHDTLLYAKQSYAELGGGGGEPDKIPPVPLGYVEADHAFWGRLAALSAMTADGLIARDLMPAEFRPRYNRFNEYAAFYRDIAAKELANQEISEEEFEKIRQSGRVFKELSDALPGESLAVKDRRAGIIADIHTDALEGKILYQATGKPYIIYIAVKDRHGARLVRGLAFNHNELVGPLASRYTDEEWQEIVYEGKGDPPAGSEWSQELVR